MAFVSSQGTSFTWNTLTFKCVDIQVEKSAPSRERVDMSTLDQADGDEMMMMLAPLAPKRDPRKFTITYRHESQAINEGDEGSLSAAGYSGTFRCTAAGEARKTNAYVEGTATFEELIADEIP